MARMVFGQWATGDSPPQVTHFTTKKLVGEKTGCGVTMTRNMVPNTTKVPKMVTCKKCLKATEGAR